jgi:hypothetical protein
MFRDPDSPFDGRYVGRGALPLAVKFGGTFSGRDGTGRRPLAMAFFLSESFS